VTFIVAERRALIDSTCGVLPMMPGLRVWIDSAANSPLRRAALHCPPLAVPGIRRKRSFICADDLLDARMNHRTPLARSKSHAPDVVGAGAGEMDSGHGGGDEARSSAMKSGRLDYDARIADLEVVDRYTLTIRLKPRDMRFLYMLAVPSTAAVAREIVEACGNDIGAPRGNGKWIDDRSVAFRISRKSAVAANNRRFSRSATQARSGGSRPEAEVRRHRAKVQAVAAYQAIRCRRMCDRSR